MKLLVVDDVDFEFVSMLRHSGFTCDVDELNAEADVVRRIRGYVGLVMRGRPTIGTEVFAAADVLRFVARFGSGVEHIDCESARKNAVEVIRAPEALATAVAEHALGAVLMVLRKLRVASISLGAGCWERDGYRGHELTGSTVGIVGYGNTGSAFARLLRGFEVRILAYDKYKTGFADSTVEETSLETIQREANILSLHVPLTGETRKMIDAAFVDGLGNQIVMVNTSRGEVVDTGALVHGLQMGRILGAVLDVHEIEGRMLPGNLLAQRGEIGMQYAFLAGHPAVVLTPHIAGWTTESLVRMRVILHDRICRFMGVGSSSSDVGPKE
jgi:D-3-phosphoglycerate dehydrogenase